MKKDVYETRKVKVGTEFRINDSIQNSYYFLTVKNGEIVLAGCHEPEYEYHNIDTQRNPKWETVDYVLQNFFQRNPKEFIAICQMLQGYTDAYRLAQRYVNEKIADIKIELNMWEEAIA